MLEYTSNRQRNLKIGISSYTENQLVLDVIGNTNIIGNATIGDVTITSSGIITASNPGVSTVIYYGDGSNLIGVNAFNVVTQDAISTPVYPTFANNVGVSSVGISSTQFVFIPSTGALGIGTTNPTSKLTVFGDGLFTGILTANTFRPSSGFIQSPNGTNAFYIYDGTGNVAFQGTIGASQINNASGFKVIGFAGTDATFENNVYISGVTTSIGGFIGNLTGTATTATKLENIRTFQITGDIVASPQNFDGTQNVSLASSISPNSVGLGTYTYGDYVKNITGTIGEIEVSLTSGEGVSPQIGLPDNVTIGNNLTVLQDLQVNRNLNVDGNITIGGTTAYLIVNEFRVKDKDIVLGFTTDSNGNDVSNDTTANHGGIAVASTEGSPLVSLFNPGIGETTPATYKKIMWFKSGSFVGLNTDAWLINYGVGIGSTQVPNGVRLAVGGIQFTDNDLKQIRNINASGIITGSTFRPSSGFIQSPNGTNAFYIYDGTGNVAFQGTIGASQINNASGFKVIGFAGTDATFENNVYISGVTTSIGGFIGNLTGTATTATNAQGLIGEPNLVVGVITASSFIGNLTGTATTATNAQGLIGEPNITVGVITATSFVGSGSSLTGVQIGIQSGGNFVGFANTINFTGVGATFITVSSGIATVNIPGIVKTYTYYIATEGQTTFASYYNAENVEVYMNGSKLSHVSYDATSGTQIVLNEGATQNDEIEIIGYYAYNFFNIYSNYAENLIGTPNINAGIVSAIAYYGDGSNLTGVTTSLLGLTDVDSASVGNNKYLRYNQSIGKFDFKTLDLTDFSIDIDGGVSSTVYEPLEFIIGDGGNASTNYFPTDFTLGGGGA